MFDPRNSENDFFNRLGYDFDASQLAAGKVLISEPFLNDPNFARSVVLLTHYKPDEGAVGFIINKPTDLKVSDVLDSFMDDQFLFHIGGPVEPETLFFLHTLAAKLDDSHEVFDHLHWSANYEGIQTLISIDQADHTQVKFLGGYSGWSPGQLEEEMKEKAWLISALSAAQIMNGNPHELWRIAMENLGPKFSIMANFPENPSMN